MKIVIRRKGVVASEITLGGLGFDTEILYLRTAKEHRGKGFASSLIEKAKKKFPSLVAFLEPDGTGLTIDQMEAWYKRRGFRYVQYDFSGRYKSRRKNIKKVMYWQAD